MSGYSSITGHRSMVYDELRNSAYASALKQYVTQDSVVMDLGSGLGIHGLIAASLGARRVYLVEPGSVNTVAALLADENGVAGRVTCVQKKIEEAELPEKADIIVSVFTGNFLLEEDLLPSLFFARDKYLKAGGKLIPDAAEMEVVPVGAAQYHDRHIGQWSSPSQGVSLSKVRHYAANSLYYDGAKNREAVFLAEPATLMNLDFNTAQRAECSSDVVFEVTEPGPCHGFLGWFRMRLGDEWLSTSPKAPALHWSQVFLPLDPPVEFAKGQAVKFRLHRPQFGEWTWSCTSESGSQRRSTFFSRALANEGLRHRTRTHRVELNTQGELVRFVIAQMNGNNSLETIHQMAKQSFAGKFSTARELEQQVEAILSSCGK